MERLTPRQEEMLAILVQRYDQYGADDPIYFDTWSGHIKRTLRVLEKKGLITCWSDADDPSRLWAAINPPKFPED